MGCRKMPHSPTPFPTVPGAPSGGQLGAVPAHFECDILTVRSIRDWPDTLGRISHSRSDVLLLSGQVANSDATLRHLRQIALARSDTGIVAAATVRTMTAFGGQYRRIFSCGRSIFTPLGLTAEPINLHSGEVPVEEELSELIDAPSIWSGAVYIKRALLERIHGFDTSYIPSGVDLEVPNILFDDLCLQARQAAFRVLCAKNILADIDSLSVEYPNQSTTAYCHWQEKWGWDPFLPNPQHFRQRWQGTEFGRVMTDDLLDIWPQPEPKVDVVMLTGNSLAKLRPCLESLARTDYPALQLHILLNGSNEPTRRYLHQLASDGHYPFPVQLIATPINIGVSAGLNWLLTHCENPLIARLDDDVELPAQWLRDMVATLRRFPYAGAVLPAYSMPAGDEWNLAKPGRLFPRFCDTEPADKMPPFPYRSLYRTNFFAGAAAVCRRKAVERAGPYDIHFSPSQNEDMDHGLALRLAGYDILVNGRVMAVHHSSATDGASLKTISSALAQRQFLSLKWGRSPAIVELALDRDGRVIEP